MPGDTDNDATTNATTNATTKETIDGTGMESTWATGDHPRGRQRGDPTRGRQRGGEGTASRVPLSFDRRTFLAAATAGAALGTVAGTVAGSHDDQFDTVRSQVLDPYLTDPQGAADDGFEIGGPYVPSMGWHFLNQENVTQATVTGLEVTQPQVLVYVDERFVPSSTNRLAFDSETGLRLGAVEYAIPRGAGGHTEDNPPDLFDDEHADLETSERAGWHVHPKAEHAFLTPDGETADRMVDPGAYWAQRLDTTNWLELVPGGLPGNPQLSEGDEVKGHFGHGSPFGNRTVVSSSVHPDLLTLHVWLGVDNPDGVFAGHNESIVCGDTHGH